MYYEPIDYRRERQHLAARWMAIFRKVLSGVPRAEFVYLFRVIAALFLLAVFLLGLILVRMLHSHQPPPLPMPESRLPLALQEEYFIRLHECLRHWAFGEPAEISTSCATQALTTGGDGLGAGSHPSGETRMPQFWSSLLYLMQSRAGDFDKTRSDGKSSQRHPALFGRRVETEGANKAQTRKQMKRNWELDGLRSFAYLHMNRAASICQRAPEGWGTRYIDLSKRKIFIAINLFNSVDVFPELVAALLGTIQSIGPAHVSVSFYENGSRDKTKQLLRPLSLYLAALRVNHTVVLDEEKHPMIFHRIAYLAAVRNRAFFPLQNSAQDVARRFGSHATVLIGRYSSAGTVLAHYVSEPNSSVEPTQITQESNEVFSIAMNERPLAPDRILFLNDIVFCHHDILELLHQSFINNADITCAIDYSNGIYEDRSTDEKHPTTEYQNAPRTHPSPNPTGALDAVKPNYKKTLGSEKFEIKELQNPSRNANVKQDKINPGGDNDRGNPGNESKVQKIAPDGTEYDANGPKFYDTWVARDMRGVPFASYTYDRFLEKNSTQYNSTLMQAPFQVYCCWNGAAVLNPAPFLWHNVSFRRGNQRPGECDGSECSNICKDYLAAGYHRNMVVPRVKVAYDLETLRSLKDPNCTRYARMFPADQAWRLIDDTQIAFESPPLQQTCQPMEGLNNRDPDRSKEYMEDLSPDYLSGATKKMYDSG